MDEAPSARTSTPDLLGGTHTVVSIDTCSLLVSMLLRRLSIAVKARPEPRMQTR
jgi:hypothetical protein